MNVYFLLEGKRTEKKVYPHWLSILVPNLKQVKFAYEVKQNNYYMISGNGFPALLHNHLKNSIEEVNDIGRYDYLTIILDAEDETIENRMEEVENFVKNNNLSLKNCKLEIIVQHRTIETWFLGNSRIFKQNPDDKELAEYIKFYNVSINDPELMGIFDGFTNYAYFHHSYLVKMLLERNIKYSKKFPRGVIEKYYLNELQDRVLRHNSHLKSLQNFFDFCEKIAT